MYGSGRFSRTAQNGEQGILRHNKGATKTKGKVGDVLRFKSCSERTKDTPEHSTPGVGDDWSFPHCQEKQGKEVIIGGEQGMGKGIFDDLKTWRANTGGELT